MTATMLEACAARKQASPATKPAPEAEVPSEVGSVVARLRLEAASLEPLVEADWVREFLRGTALLPFIEPRTLLHDPEKKSYYTEAEAAALPEDERRALASRVLDEEFYYTTRYGTPLAYARPLDLLARSGFRPQGRRVLDFGFGGIGQLRLLASLGVHVVGVEVDPLTRALYTWPGDQGDVTGRGGESGSLRLVYGQFPGEPSVKQAVGRGYDLVLSKNTLKRGYVHPEQPVPDRQRIDLGVDDGTFARALLEILDPGGRLMIYNLCPAQNPPGKPYIPWADGRSPFTRSGWEAAGFRVVVIDEDDSSAARRMTHALGWDAGEQPMDLERDLFALYTIVEKP